MNRTFFCRGSVTRIFSLISLAALLIIAYGCGGNKVVTDEGSYLHVRADEARARGIEAYTKGKYSVALQSFDSALKIDRAVDDRESEILDLINIGRVSIALKDMAGAEKYLDMAVKVSLDADTVISLGEAYATLAKVEYLTGRHDLALSHIEESIEVDKRHGVKSGAALNLMGVILAEGGRIEEAHHVLVRALKLNTDNADLLERANSYRSLGHLHSIQKEHAKAVEQYRLAYDLDTKAGNSVKIAVDLSSMAKGHQRLGQMLKSTYLLERSYIVNLNGGRPIAALENLKLLIDTYTELGMTDKVHFFSRIRGSLLKAYENGKGGM